MKLLVRADDLGFCEAINYGIEKTVNAGMVKSVGLMPNMDAAEHGVKLLKEYDICLGQHTNICLGKPSSDISKIPSLVQENGYFKCSKEYREAAKKGEDFVVIEEAIIEVEEQYHRFVELTGKQPEYFEAHAVASKNLFIALKTVANKYNLKLNDFNFENNVSTYGDKEVYYAPMESLSQGYNPTDSLKRAISDAKEEYPCIFVCHPGYLDNYVLEVSSLTLNRVKEVDMLCDKEIHKCLKEQDIQLISYRDI